MTIMAALSAACAQESPLRIRCELSVPQTLAAAQAAAITFTLTNAGEQVIQVLNWQTPFEGIRAPLFTVMRDGTAVEYRGVMIKRGGASKQDYLVLKPGERRSVTIDLADGWDVAAPGSYTVEYSALLFDVIAGTAAAPRPMEQFSSVMPTCNTVAFARTP